ncbi:MAG: DUF2213 domain-containing protein [Acidobacteriaceae bacterium]
MYAAAEGKSTLGIPENVGKEFIRADDAIVETEREAAIAIAEKRALSPLRYQNAWLYAIRITGTGVSYRSGLKEYVWRSPEVFLAEEFVDRCNGLPVILIHPEKTLLNEEEYANRNVGSIIYPYRDGEDVWGIARIFDETIIEEMRSGHLSTSPGVRFTREDELASVELGKDVLTIEGNPSLLDHIAIVPAGVWDKGGPPSGIRNDSAQRKDIYVSEKEKDCAMTDGEKRADAEKTLLDRLDSIATTMDGIGKRLDALEKERGDGRRRDSEEERKERERKEREDRERKDAKRRDGEPEETAPEEPETERGDRKRKDAKRRDGEEDIMDRERKDRERRDAEERERKEREDRDRKDRGRKDAEEKERKEREDRERKDASTSENEELRRQIAAMQSKIDNIAKAPDYSDMDRLAAAQTRADAVLQVLGERPEKPFAGESSTSYRKRILARLKKHSAKLKDIAFDGLNGPAFDTIETAIYNDAQEAARAPTAIKGRLIPIVTEDSTGRRITRYVGDPRVWRSQFDANPVAFSMARPGVN